MRYPGIAICAAAVLLAAAVASTEDPGGVRVEADRTGARILPDSSVVKEYSGNVRILGRSIEARADRAVLEADTGVFRLSGGPRNGRMVIRVLADSGRERVRFSARDGALFVREGAADSAFAVGNVRVEWRARNARADADTVRWSAARRLIWADGSIRLALPGVSERGTALEADDDLKWYTMRGVSGTIRPRGRK